MPEAVLFASARRLGYAGLVPQAVLVAAALLIDPVMRDGAAAVGFAYAALIFSFLGGVWWGLALHAGAPCWLFPVSVLPSLIAFATSLFPMLAGTGWQLPNLLIGAALLASPLIDRAMAHSIAVPAGWLRLRWQLSIGLGVMTMLLGIGL